MSFSLEQIAELEAGREEINVKFQQVRQRLILTPFSTALAREHTDHGLARRLGILAHCINRVSELLPPAQIDIPDSQQIADATVYIQAFVLNTFGCCENLAWMWVSERGVMNSNGQPLPEKRIGLGPGYRQLRASFPLGFRTYLETFDGWFAHLKDFRDALAHRIPLYIPPYCIDTERGAEFQTLEAQASAALMQGDLDAYQRICAERDSLRHFKPIMVHSLADPRPVIFHYQLQADFNTIVDITEHLLTDLT